MIFQRHCYHQSKIMIIFMLMFLCAGSVFAATITGIITDAATGEPLPGANIYLEGTSLDAASGLDGSYVILNVPQGRYTVTVTYIGYEKVTSEIQVLHNQKAELDIEMSSVVREGEVVTVTAQAEAQLQAMNQQVSAITITNIVSKKQIQELPEANAAEAVGRLPGVYLERCGGEGNNVVIRGMTPKYSLIQIDGVNMTATGAGDRSTDISMISPYMLEGIELTKSVTANQEATATGGIVNFRIKKAPKIASFNVIAQGGANNLRNTYQDYKVSAGGSNRFCANLLGIYAQVDYEEKNTGSQQLGGVWFSQENMDAPVRTNGMQLMDIFRNVQRLGGALVLDYSLPSTLIKSSNFFNRNIREETGYINNYDYAYQGFGLYYEDTPERWLTVITNLLQIDHRCRNWEISSTFSHSFSENVLPTRISSSNNNSPINPFPTDRTSGYNIDLDPETIPDLLQISMDDAVHFMHLGGMNHEESETSERDLAGELNLAYTFNITDQINIKLSLGGKYKHKEKEYDFESLSMGGQNFLDLVFGALENEFSDRTRQEWAANDLRILLIDFLDQGYDGSDFLDGRYDFGHIFDKTKFRRIHDLVMERYDPTSTNAYDMTQKNFVISNYNDYHGVEDYHAFYLMPEINLGAKLLFVPGVRYEANRTEYTGYRGNRLGVLRDWRATPIDTVTKVRNNEFWLPMFQTFYKPTDWLTFKAGYTHTLQRPDYKHIIPGWVINSQGYVDNWGNFRLKPELSRNWDIQMSVHSDKIGLFSVGAFHKKITDMIFWTGQKVITDTAFFELPTYMQHQKVAYATNNPNDVFNYGYEVEWKTNFWYLPGLLKGLVMNVNYTYPYNDT